MDFILASKSPRRNEILKESGYNFITIESGFDETLVDFSNACKGVEEIALGKAKSVFENLPELSKQNSLVLGADTIVVCDDKVLLKPKTKAEAVETLTYLSDKVHHVYTAVAFVTANGEKSFVEDTKVYFHKLTKKQIEEYVATGEPMDKAGAYGIQGLGRALVNKIEGDYLNVVGLPLERVAQHLASFGITPRKD